jgi:hypothetical protein
MSGNNSIKMNIMNLISLDITFNEKLVLNSFKEENIKLETNKMTDTLNWNKNVLENQSITLTDSDDTYNLKLYSYTTIDEYTSDEVKECRGVILHNDELIVKTFGYSPEFVDSDKEQISSYLMDNFDNCRFYNSEEGTILRLYYVENKWFLSTHKKLNSFKSKWGNFESFGDLFLNALNFHFTNNQNFRDKMSISDDSSKDKIFESFCDTLDKSKIYMFMVTNNQDNRIVCENKNSMLYHVGTFSEKGFNFTMDEQIGLPYPEELSFKDIDEVLEFVKSIDYKKLQGVFVLLPNNKQMKILNSTYHRLMKLRGNDPSVIRRYLFLKNTPSDLKDYIELYPEFSKKFEVVEKTLDKVSSKILNAYIRRFINGEFIEVPQEEYQVIRTCHSWHNENRNTNKIYFGKVKEFLLKQHPLALYKMVDNNTNGYGI